MKLKITWDGNDDGAVRWLNQSGSTVKLWVLVKDEDDKPLASPCTLRCTVKSTLFLRWLRRAGPRLRRRPSQQPMRLKVVQRNAASPEFIVTGTPKRFLPYWLELQATEGGVQRERTRLFVAPRANRLLSMVFVGLGGVFLAYSSWLWWNLRSEALPQQYSTIFGTAWALLAPFGAVAAPFLSASVRRFGSDALASGAVMCACLSMAIGLLHYQSPLYLENNTPSPINAAADGKRVVVEPGAAAVVPRDHLDSAWLEAIGQQRQKQLESLPPDHWFKAGEYCLYEARSKNCVELRPASFLTQMQRWLAPQGGIRIGCNAIEGLDTDAIEAWKKSGSCRHDPEVSVKRSLHDHLVRNKIRKAEKVPCNEPEGEVTLKPFRTASRSEQGSPLRPTQIALIWPENARDAVPSWHFSSSGPLADIMLQPALSASGEPCPRPYIVDCPSDTTQTCPGLFVPPGQISATLSLGEQKLGTLWCSPPAGNILTLRLRSRVLGLSIVDDEGQTVSRFASDSEVTGGWVAWCEPPRGKPGTPMATTPTLHAEVTLPDDWQPVAEWEWHAPAGSSVNTLDIFIRGRGRWGRLDCLAASQERIVWLQEVNNTHTRAVREATAAASHWRRYGETTLFPRWIWRCGLTKDKDAKLSAVRDDGTAGTIVSSSFAPSPAAACVIDPLTGARLPGRAPSRPGNADVAVLLERFKIAGCDPKKSVFAMAGGR
jgi:hypothetical protein